jgi:hypothetical protein
MSSLASMGRNKQKAQNDASRLIFIDKWLHNSSLSSNHNFFPTNRTTDPNNSVDNPIPSPNLCWDSDESNGKLPINARKLHADSNCDVSNDTMEKVIIKVWLCNVSKVKVFFLLPGGMQT